MERYLLRNNEDYEYIASINNAKIETTKDLEKVMIFDKLEKAKALKTYINLETDYDTIDILEIELKEVKDQ